MILVNPGAGQLIGLGASYFPQTTKVPGHAKSEMLSLLGTALYTLTEYAWHMLVLKGMPQAHPPHSLFYSYHNGECTMGASLLGVQAGNRAPAPSDLQNPKSKGLKSRGPSLRPTPVILAFSSPSLPPPPNQRILTKWQGEEGKEEAEQSPSVSHQASK